mgnify:CR=1 FL=1
MTLLDTLNFVAFNPLQNNNPIAVRRRYPVPVWSGRSGGLSSVQLRCYCCVTPGHEFVQTSDLMLCDLGEDPCEPGLGIDTVELGGLNEGIGDCRGLTATFGAYKEKILTSQSQFPSILPMSGQFIAFNTGGTRITMPMLKSIDPIGEAMGRMWRLNETQAFPSWLQLGVWMPRFAG